MITVFIWDFRGKNVAWGHASMQVQQTYVSWWPEGGNRIREYPTASKIPILGRALGNVYSAHPFRNQTFDTDCEFEAEGSESEAKTKLPDHRIFLNGLDESAILNWWQSFGLTRNGMLFNGPLPAWHTTSMNCSTVVATGLEKGGGDKYAGGWLSRKLVWKPNDVLRYALAIQCGMSARR